MGYMICVLFILPLLALIIPPFVLKNMLKDKLWLKWGLIFSGVWLAQIAACFISVPILRNFYGPLGPLGALVFVWPQFHIWYHLFDTMYLLFFLVVFIPYFMFGAVIGLIIQKVKAERKTE